MDELGYKISIIAIVIILIVGACILLAYVTLMGLKIAKTRSNRVNGETGKIPFSNFRGQILAVLKSSEYHILLSLTINGHC